uniref:Uncharacterized protein n=1 Tax=Candidatus Kentrum eta TaxID=2126337 RepID=A0A450UV73_9GAMM|nr:MAG: hypothetical protein BECKH772A_GA0070896_101049 [Candidatus Kentron sp. H]VFJ97518.1 MAG: hypothetical protein BECKH772B_GA0070898_101139 [Candidatus Kentron sp. H]VFK02825.1 MAG: hypothetical protein BECKH772C_GA0070978_101049 [Candidatus Kentron sp. H]
MERDGDIDAESHNRSPTRHSRNLFGSGCVGLRDSWNGPPHAQQSGVERTLTHRIKKGEVKVRGIGNGSV